jgi:hypothetical protein
MSQVVLELIEKYENIILVWEQIKDQPQRYDELTPLCDDTLGYIINNFKQPAKVGTPEFSEQNSILLEIFNDRKTSETIQNAKSTFGVMLPNKEVVFPTTIFHELLARYRIPFRPLDMKNFKKWAAIYEPLLLKS